MSIKILTYRELCLKLLRLAEDELMKIESGNEEPITKLDELCMANFIEVWSELKALKETADDN